MRPKYFKNSQPLEISSNQYALHLVSLDLQMFPLIEDFVIKIKESSPFGLHLYFQSDRYGKLAGFPWWDNVDKDLSRFTIQDIPVGSIEKPFDDLEQGWQILIFQTREYVYILQGKEPCCRKFPVWFRVKREQYLNEWIRVISS